MMLHRLSIMIWMLCFYSASERAYALSDNTFSLGGFLGDSYSPTNFRASLGKFDLGYSDLSNLYAGSRLWKDNYYAGFGFGIQKSVYGMVGYEWRFVPWAGLSFEFDGGASTSGSVAGRGYIGIVAGW